MFAPRPSLKYVSDLNFLYSALCSLWLPTSLYAIGGKSHAFDQHFFSRTNFKKSPTSRCREAASRSRDVGLFFKFVLEKKCWSKEVAFSVLPWDKPPEHAQPNQCFLFRFLFLCSQSVSVSFCFCFPNLFQLLVSVLFLFLFSQSVNASDGETVRPQDRDYVFCTEFEHRWTNASCLGFCFYVPNLFLSVSVFPICFCFLSLFKFLFS